jgi:ribose transport system substrate-binding protein
MGGRMATQFFRSGVRLVVPMVTVMAFAIVGVGASGPLAGASRRANVSVATCGQEAQAAVAKAEASIPAGVPKGRVSRAASKGKTFWFISASQSVPDLYQTSQGVQAAGKAAGIKIHIFDGTGSVSGFNQGVSEAVANNAAGIILQGITPSLVSSPLAAAKRAHIPVIDAQNGDFNAPLTNGILAHISTDFTKDGRTMADYVLANTGCKADVLELTTTLYVGLTDTHNGFKQQLNQLCPSCTLQSLTVNFSTIATSVPQQVNTALLQDPNINYVVPDADGIGFYAAPAAHSQKVGIPVIGHDGSPANLAFIRQGVQTADLAYPPPGYIGWKEVDMLIRARAHVPLPSGYFPTRLFDKSNLPSTNSAAKMFPSLTKYQALFRAVWKN